mmetsp:Transcript_33419/g.92490  ORF Transcript_33419/g.92490 Transcript_33419/m.92490 type:complete len:215 (+) Transcript_33419:1059-1703(+)
MNNKSHSGRVSEIAVKSRMSENMIVTTRRDTCRRAARGSPRTILRTTVSGTKRAKASVACERWLRVRCRLLTSAMLERLLSWASADSREKSKSPSCRIRSSSCLSGRETAQPRPSARPRLSTTTPTKIAALGSQTSSASPAERPPLAPPGHTAPDRTVPDSARCTTRPALPFPGSTATTSQRVRASITTERVATNAQLLSPRVMTSKSQGANSE